MTRQSWWKKINGFALAISAGVLAGGGYHSVSGDALLREKIAKLTAVRAMTGSVGKISLEAAPGISDPAAVEAMLTPRGLFVESIYYSRTAVAEYGELSLGHPDASVRAASVDQILAAVHDGRGLGDSCKRLVLPIREGFEGSGGSHKLVYKRLTDSLKAVYEGIPDDWNLLLGYSVPYPDGYFTVPDWGTCLSVCQQLGERAAVLTRFGKGIADTNIEQLAARLQVLDRFGGIHFQGAPDAYSLFLLFCESIQLIDDSQAYGLPVLWMLSGNTQGESSVENILDMVQALKVAYARALLLDLPALCSAQESNDFQAARRILEEAFHLDVWPLVAEAGRVAGAALDPSALYRSLKNEGGAAS